MTDRKKIQINIETENAGQRVDVFLAEFIDGYSRARIQKLIEEGALLVSDKQVKRSYKLREGDVLNLLVPDDKPVEIIPENIPLEIIYEDNYLAVVNKPTGMLTHPAPGKYTGTLVNALLYHCGASLSGINGFLRPGILHRLDKDTSGLIVIAKNDLAHQHIANQIQDRLMDKYYLAVVQGNLKEDTGIINAPIGRHPLKREKMAVIENAREAITHWKVLERFGVATLIEAKLITGRTHQLRVHFCHIAHPILGDPLYGNVKSQKIKLECQALQAYKISFTHPKSYEKLSFNIGFNEDITRLLKIFNSQYMTGEKEL